jgi:DNA processing protein
MGNNLLEQKLRCWLGLSLSTNINGEEVQSLCQQLGGEIADLFTVSKDALIMAGASKKFVAQLAQMDWTAADQAMRWQEEPGHFIVHYGSPQYPTLMAQVKRAPLVIYGIGDPTLLLKQQVGIVGSRNPTVTGVENARRFAAALVQAGFAVTSGMALGVDAEAHQSALNHGGSTIGVAGTGVDQAYPKRNEKLIKQIREKGATVSEFPIGTPARPENFPQRNRIISGLSCGTLVIEATLRSGSLITARMSAEEGREVFAIPGSIHNPLARGCHKLIKEGAHLVENIDDILSQITYALACAHETDPVEELGEAHLNEELKEVFSAVGFEVTPVDLIIQRTGQSAKGVGASLFDLELKGCITAEPGGYIRSPKGGR